MNPSNFNTFWDYLDVLILTTLFFAPAFQIFKIWKCKKTENISFWTWLSLLISSVGIFTFSLQDAYQEYANPEFGYDIQGIVLTGIFVVENALVLFLIWKYREKKPKTLIPEKL